MKIKVHILIISMSAVFYSGCLRTYYPVIHLTNASPMIQEREHKLNSHSGFMGADLTISKGLHDDEYFNLMKVSYLNTNTTDYININYQGFGYSGFYRVAGLNPEYDGNKNVIGLGADFKFGANFKIDKFKAGLGLNAGAGIEFGEYYGFRVNAERAGLIETNSSILFGIISLYPYFSYDISETTVLSTQVNVGLPGLFSPSLVLNSDGYIYWISWMPGKNLKENFYEQRLNLGMLINIDKFTKSAANYFNQL